MDPATQITVTMVGSVGAFLTALFISAILIRLLGPQQNTAAEERKTLLERIEYLREQHDTEFLFDTETLCEVKLLREEMKEYRRVTNYIVFDHTANRIVGDVAGTVNPEGEVTKFRLFQIEGHIGHRVRLLAILSDGEGAHVF